MQRNPILDERTYEALQVAYKCMVIPRDLGSLRITYYPKNDKIHNKGYYLTLKCEYVTYEANGKTLLEALELLVNRVQSKVAIV